MPKKPRLPAEPTSQSRQQLQPLSAPMILIATALDTTWRIFVPTLAGVFAGIGLDRLFGSAPIATIICLILGTILSALLIARQLINVRKPL